MGLGQWTILDIETTGLSAADHHIIDIGFLQFEGTQLVQKYESLVHTDFQVSYFLQNLTGISSEMLQKAPAWSEVKQELRNLEKNVLIAHNAAFENQFLATHLEALQVRPQLAPMGLYFQDSLFYLSLLNPGRTHLNLESFIIEHQIKDHESHRGLEDSIDLLKVLLAETYRVRCNQKMFPLVQSAIQQISTDHFWFRHLFELSMDGLERIADQLNFQLRDHSIEPSSESVVAKTRQWSGLNAENLEKAFELMKEKDLEVRQTQKQMAKRVSQSLVNGVHSMVQAPTGTGKTLAYLIPAVLYAQQSQKPVVISTASKSLQEQAHQKDLKLVEEILQTGPVKAVQLLGTQNHFCEVNYRETQELQQLDLSQDLFSQEFFRSYFSLIFSYHKISSDFITTDSIPYVLSKSLPQWQHRQKLIQLNARACLGSDCPYEKGCSYRESILKARQADLLIVNHALFFNWPQSLPQADSVIIDEAHRLESYLDSAISYEIQSKELQVFLQSLISGWHMGALLFLLRQLEIGENQIKSLQNDLERLKKKIQEEFDPLDSLMERFFQDQPRYQEVFWNEREFKLPHSELGVMIKNHLDSLFDCLKNYSDQLTKSYQKIEQRNFQDEQLMALNRFENFYLKLQDLLDTFQEILTDNPEHCRVMKFLKSEGFILKSTPIEATEKAKEMIYQDRHAVILNSATLMTLQGDFGSQLLDWSTGYHLLEQAKRFESALVLPPIFDYQKSAQVYLVDDTPNMNSEEFIPTIMDLIIPHIMNLSGKSLLLFSSNIRFEKAREVLLQTLASTDIQLFYQGMGKTTVEDFKKASKAILLGKEAFSEGIDLPGDLLKFIYVDKIPDLSFDLLTQKRRQRFQEKFGNEFQDYFLVTRAKLLLQKLGRLIRSASDSGQVVISDGRTAKWKSATHQSFAQMMRPYEIEKCSLQNLSEKLKK